jgi:hypothetical protein
MIWVKHSRLPAAAKEASNDRLRRTMIFLGPGSEWFWAAATGVILAATLVAIYRQLLMQRRELDENTKLLRSQAHANALSLAQRPWELLVDNASLADLIERGYADPKQLSEAEWRRFSAYCFMQFNAWEYFYYQHLDGSIPVQLWTGAQAAFRFIIRAGLGVPKFWAEARASFDEPFRSEVDREVAVAVAESAPMPATERLNSG